MASVLKISEAASLALHTCAYLAKHPDSLVSTRDIAKVLSASAAHLSKVLQRLSHAGIVSSIRGPHGGFKLHRPAAKIALLEIYETIEGPFTSGDCLHETPICGGKNCVFGELLKKAHRLSLDYFTKTTLARLDGVFIK